MADLLSPEDVGALREPFEIADLDGWRGAGVEPDHSRLGSAARFVPRSLGLGIVGAVFDDRGDCSSVGPWRPWPS
jgi:hypothetical protein